MKARLEPAAFCAYPDTCPAELIAVAALVAPPKVPTSVMENVSPAAGRTVSAAAAHARNRTRLAEDISRLLTHLDRSPHPKHDPYYAVLPSERQVPDRSGFAFFCIMSFSNAAN